MQDKANLHGSQHIHLVGIGGIGVSALVPLLMKQGHIVTGSDPATTPVTDRLAAMGVAISHTHQAENIEGATLVVASSAIPASNPELQAAQAKQIPIWPRAKMLGHLLNDTRAIVITGAHGKTSITAMATKVLTDCGSDPTAFIGGDITSLGGNTRIGESGWSIAEGDESDGSLIYLRPEIALINNIDSDHLDFYSDIDAIIKQFETFIQGVRKGGWLLYSSDCEYAAHVARSFAYHRLSFGFGQEADLRGVAYQANRADAGCEVLFHGEKIGRLQLPLCGRFNYHNALGVLAIAHAVGLSFDRVFDSLSSFQGVQRRMEVKGVVNGITVMDDYAHHPTEIAATIQGLKEKSQGRVIAVFQPHLYSRTQKLLPQFSQAFHGLDHVILTDIYAAREAPVAGVTGEILLRPILDQGVDAVYIENPDALITYLKDYTHSGDTVVTLGAGSIWQLGERFLHFLETEEDDG